MIAEGLRREITDARERRLRSGAITLLSKAEEVGALLSGPSYLRLLKWNCEYQNENVRYARERKT